MVEVKQRVSRAVIAAVVVLGSAVASGCSTAEIPGMADVLDLPADGSHVLTSGEDWQLVVTPHQALELRQERRTSGVSDYTRPLTLTEAHGFDATRNGNPVTVVAGPVGDDAARVEVESLNGVVGDAAIVHAHGMTWFWLELADDDLFQITAYDEQGEILDQRR